MESFAELFESSLVATKMKPGTIIKARVVEVTADRVVVNAGLKSEGVIDAAQFRNAKGELEVAVGDEVDVALEDRKSVV